LSPEACSQAGFASQLMSRCVNLLRALSRQNDVIQTRVFDMIEALLAIPAVHADIALLIRDVRPHYSWNMLPLDFSLLFL